MPEIKIKAPAKINLSLDVVSRREDGYHNLEMIMQEVGVYDILTVSIEGSGTTEIHLSCSKKFLPTDERNLCFKAAKLFLNKAKIFAKVRINIEKNIPVGAGLGGGSSDAAATLKALNKLTNEPFSLEELSVLGKNLGADVPFFIYGGCMLAEGIGECLTPVSPLKNAFILIAKPNFSISTAQVYKSLHLDEKTPHPNTKEILDALSKNDLNKLGKNAENSLESVTAKLYPEILEYKKTMVDNGAIYSLMSGSGSAVFGIFTDKQKAQATARLFKEKTNQVYLV